MWYQSEEYKISKLEKNYKEIRDIYKAQKIYELYGFEIFGKFVKQCPHIINLLDDYVPCKKEHNVQCTMFCHKYNFEKGCTLNATE